MTFGLVTLHIASAVACREVAIKDKVGSQRWSDDGHAMVLGIQSDTSGDERYLATWNLVDDPQPILETEWSWPEHVRRGTYQLWMNDGTRVLVAPNGQRSVLTFPEAINGPEAVSPSGRYLIYQTSVGVTSWYLADTDTAEVSELASGGGIFSVVEWVDPTG